MASPGAAFEDGKAFGVSRQNRTPRDRRELAPALPIPLGASVAPFLQAVPEVPRHTPPSLSDSAGKSWPLQSRLEASESGPDKFQFEKTEHEPYVDPPHSRSHRNRSRMDRGPAACSSLAVDLSPEFRAIYGRGRTWKRPSWFYAVRRSPRFNATKKKRGALKPSPLQEPRPRGTRKQNPTQRSRTGSVRPSSRLSCSRAFRPRLVVFLKAIT